MALDFQCEFCQAHRRPENKPPVSLNYETRLWHCVGIDNAELELGDTTVVFSLYEDEACGLVVPKVLFVRGRDDFRNPSAQEVTDAFAEAWISHYPKPVRVKTDPEGAFQSGEFRDDLTLNGIYIEPTAGEAHVQHGRIERSIQTVKRIAEKLVHEFPEATGIQILSAAAGAHNELRRIKGYSPNQMAFGRCKPQWEDLTLQPSESFDCIMDLRIAAQTHF